MKGRFIDLPKGIFKISILESLLSSLTQGRTPRDFFARLPPLNNAYSKNSIRKVVRNGIHYELDLSDYMEWLVFWGIQVEPRDSIYEMAKPANHVLDVGANIGEISLNLAKRVGPGGSVHAFEPNKHVFGKLERNVAMNPWKNIHLNNLGLGSSEENLFLEAQVASNMGGARIQRHLKEGQKVTVTTIDRYVADHRLSTVDAIKIDVEGFEMHVIEGSQKTIHDFKPTLFVEIDDNNLRDQDKSAKALISLLQDFGYQDIRHAESGEQILPSRDFAHCHFDVSAR